jgi:FkbM family methyltransferase
MFFRKRARAQPALASPRVANPAKAVSPDFVRSAYRVLLHRDVEADEVVGHLVGSGISEADLVLRILRSLEFSHGTLGTQLTTEGWTPQDAQHAANLIALLANFKAYDGPGQPGFYTDFLGVRTRTRYVAAMRPCDNLVMPPPIDRPPLFEPIEWEGMLRSVLEAKGRFVTIELGAGWAPWLVSSYAAARQRGIDDIKLAGVEASEDHFCYMLEHLQDNGIDPGQHDLLKAVVGRTDGFAHFPRIPDTHEDWGAQAVTTEGTEQTSGDFVDYRGIAFQTMDRVPCVALTTLLRRHERIDLIHCDIQDSEGEVLPAAIDELSRRVRRVVIGTHSRKSEGALLESFTRAGWTVEADRACRYVVENRRIVLLQDGIQVWANPRLAPPDSM